MGKTFPKKNSLYLILTVTLGILMPLLGYALIRYNDAGRPLWLISGKLKDNGTYLVYLPDGLKAGQKYPLVFALSPRADAMSMILVWAGVSEKHRWIIAASKESRNGVDVDILLPQIEAELNDVEKKYPTDTQRVIFTGLSGGGMASHFVAQAFPKRVIAIVINTGMMDEGSMTADYPEGKLAVFLASPTDFRFNEMHRDRAFLAAHHWTTDWIEFAGGHTFAPPDVYEQAAQWLEDHFPNG